VSVKKSKSKELFKDPNASQEEWIKASVKEIMDFDYSIPKFRCDYRTTVCLTFYSSDGTELETIRTHAGSGVGSDGHWDLDAELFPGDTTWVFFHNFVIPPRKIPAKYQVWVPK